MFEPYAHKILIFLLSAVPFLERILCLACRNSILRKRLKVGAIAYAYRSVLEKPELRLADLGSCKLWVNIKEYLGMSLYFFGEHEQKHHASLFAVKLIRPGDVCIDIGANMGSTHF